MTTHIIATAILALTFGALWHNQPAKRHKHERALHNSQFASLVSRVWKWLLHLSIPVEKKRGIFLTGTRFKPGPQTELLPSARALLAWDPWHQIVVDRTVARLSNPAELPPPSQTRAIWELDRQHEQAFTASRFFHV